MKPIIQRLKSKTYWTAILGTALVALEQASGVVSQFLPESVRGLTVLMWPVLMVALRELTTQPVSEK